MGFEALARGRNAAAVEAGPVEGPWDLPEGWRWERLSLVTSQFFSGRRPKGGVAGISSGPLSLGGEHLAWSGKLKLDTPKRIPQNFASTVESCRISVGDILVVKDGATTGKCAYVDYLPEPAYINEHVFSLRPDNSIDRKLLFYWLWSKSGFNQIMKDFRGAAQGGIGRTFVDKVAVPIPPQEMQSKLVARIDALFAEIDEGEAALAEARAAVETYRKTLLKAAFTGELTADWRAANPPQETGEQLLARILADRRARWQADPKNARKKYTEPAGPDADGLPELPDGWVWASLDQLIVGTPQNGAYFPASKYGNGVPIYRIDDFQVGTAKAVSELRQVNVRDDATAPYRIEVGDLVINRVNSPSHLGKSFLVKEENAGAIFESNMMRAKGNPLVNLDFLALYLASDGGRSRLCKNAKAAVNQSSINQGDVRATQVPLPSIYEQTAILSAVNAAAAEGQETGYVIQDCARTAATLRQSILAAAFRGELAA